MVDVDRRNTPTGLTPSHLAGLRRLSARASSTPTPAAAAAPLLPDTVLSHLRCLGVPVHRGLSDSEFAVLEAEFAFTFPPDLRSLLASGIPSSPGFPDWRRPSSIRSALRLPVSAVVLLVSRHPSLWPRSWGPRPSDPDRAIQTARSALMKSPPLIPIFDRCYIPSVPALSGNPVFYVDEDRVSCCSSDLAEFFHHVGRLGIHSSGSDPDLTLQKQASAGGKRAGGPGHIRRSTDGGGARAPRWVEFWTDIAGSVDRMQRNSSSSSSLSSMSTSSMSSSSPDRYSEAQRRRGTPKWVEEYMSGIGTVLREGGWSDAEVSEMVEVSAAGVLETGEMGLPDNEAVMDALLLKADRFSDSLRKAGWSSDDVSEAFCPDLFRVPGKDRRPARELPPEVVERIARLAETVCRS
ncbi:hypothetical protein MLD38_007712 [Melastoma candidum]|uniref:Uncharacterized protein n=1 Tax=Melastoma candidum TaxID=119954 RepID=A0ACB9RRX8_9MYRT|nr:hypothetical protein MLD38_007712 [Melastoma candidum]